MSSLPADLARLAEEAGVSTSYWDIAGVHHEAGVEPLLAVLRALGVNIHSPDEAAGVAHELRLQRVRRIVEAVVVHWLGDPLECTLRVPAGWSDRNVELCLQKENEPESLRHSAPVAALASVGFAGEADDAVELRRLRLPWGVPPGYHRLDVEIGGQSDTALIIAAPPRLPPMQGRTWGAFIPLHAIWRSRSWGVGDYSDLDSLAHNVGELGGHLIGTLPLYATFLDHPYDPSPYSPCSRLFWNEVFIDVEAVPEWQTHEDARRLAASGAFRKLQAELRRGRHVDYRAVMMQKRTVLEALCRSLVQGSSARGREFEKVLAQDQGLVDYSRFRATMEQAHGVWQDWPERPRSGAIEPSDYDESNALYHAYVQWVARSQLGDLTRRGHQAARLYLDLPLGVHPSGYDVYRHRGVFMERVSAGAPPDSFFSQGQDWGFPPFSPGRLRETDYRYFIEVLRNTFKYAAALRVDHIMGFHRLFVIPQGASAGDGVYVRYPADELYAVLLLEAHRGGCRLLVGEDLGTVPDEVRSEMDRRGLHRMFVWQYELAPQSHGALTNVPAERVASVNTHDMPTFAGFSTGTDIEDRRSLGLISQAEVESEKARRQTLLTQVADALHAGGWLKRRTTSRSLLSASLMYLASSAARVVLVNLEDLWLEAEPQNIPGTYRERPNWTRRARYSLERSFRQSVVHKTLEKVNSLRRRRPSAHE